MHKDKLNKKCEKPPSPRKGVEHDRVAKDHLHTSGFLFK